MIEFLCGIIFIICLQPILEHLTGLGITFIEYLRNKLHRLMNNEEPQQNNIIGFHISGEDEKEE